MRVTITRAEHEALSQDQQAMYGPIEGGAKFRLLEAIELMAAVESRLAEFRENNRSLNGTLQRSQQELEAMRALREAAGQRNPDDLRAALQRLEQLEQSGVAKPDDIAARIAQAVTPLQTQLQQLTATLTQKDQALAAQQLDGLLRGAAIEAGVEDNMHEEFNEAARRAGATLRDGAVVFERSGAPVYVDGAVLTVRAFVDDLRARKPQYFRQSVGSGTPGGRPGTPAPNAPKVIKRSEMAQYIKELAAGTVVVGE